MSGEAFGTYGPEHAVGAVPSRTEREPDCTCADEFDKKLEAGGYNTRISRTINMRTWTARPHIASEQIETGRGKKKAVVIAPSHCPFCGTKYPEPINAG